MSIRRMGLAAALLALAASPLAAQGDPGHGEFGLKVGMTFGDISHKGVLPGDLDTRNGVAGGLTFGFRSGVVGIGIDALYAQRGAKSSQSLATARTRLDYIDVPVYLKVGLPTPGIRPYLYAGPQVSFEVRCERANASSCDGGTEEHKDVVYAGIIGAGLRLGGKTGLTLEGRYVYGLTDLKLTTVTSSESFKHRTFMVLLGVGF